MTVEDLFSRFSLSIEVGLGISAKLFIEVLEDCIKIYGTPRVIRTDQGTEFRSFTF